MKLGTLSRYTNKLIKGKRIPLFFICIAVLGTSLFFRLAEAAVYSVVLYTGEITPMELFSGDLPALTAITLICTVMRYITSAPLSAASAFSFMKVCSENKNNTELSFGQALLSPKLWRKSIAALIISKAVGLLTLAPAFFFGSASIYFMKENSLFPAVHAAVLALAAAVIWLRTKISMSVVPYLMAKFPEISLFRIFQAAFHIMKNRRLTLVRIVLRFGLTLRLPKLFAAAALFISISIKEEEYLERIDLHSRLGSSHDSPKFSHRSKRRFKKAAE